MDLGIFRHHFANHPRGNYVVVGQRQLQPEIFVAELASEASQAFFESEDWLHTLIWRGD